MNASTIRAALVHQVLAVGLAALALAPAALADSFVWSGYQNNNWDNATNWSGAPGFPDDATDYVHFKWYDTYTREVDLRGGDRDVNGMFFDDLVNDYNFVSNTGGRGVLRLHGLIQVTYNGLFGEVVSANFSDAIDLVQAGTGDWKTFGNSRIVVDANLGGSGQINAMGSINLGSANSFSGIYALEYGLTTLGNADALANAFVSVNYPNTLDINGFNANFGALAGNEGLDIGNRTVTVGSRNTASTYSGAFSGIGDLVKVGTADWTLSGHNTFTGTVTVEDGNITIGSDDALVKNTVILHKSGPGGLKFGGANRTIGGLAGTGLLFLDHTLSVGSNNRNVTYSGVLQGDGAVVKVGGGIQTFSGSNSYTGGTFLTKGALAVSQDDNLGDPNGGLTFKGGGLSAIDSFVMSRDLDFANTNDSGSFDVRAGKVVKLDGSISGGDNNVLNLTGPGVLRLNSASTYSGNLWVQDGAVRLANADALQNATVVVDADNGLDVTTAGVDATVAALSGAGNIDLGSQTLTISNGWQQDYSGILSGAGGVIKTGPGLQALSSANTFSGGVAIENGTLRLGHSNAAGSGGIAMDDATIEYVDGIDVANSIDLQHGVTMLVASGAATQSGDIDGAFRIAKEGDGALELAGDNPSISRLDFSAGTLALGSDTAAGAGLIRFVGGNQLDFVGGVRIANDMRLGNDVALRASDGTSTYSGTLTGIDDNYSVEKIGPSTLNVTGSMTVQKLNVSAGRISASGATLNIVANQFDALLARQTGRVTLGGGTQVAIGGGAAGTPRVAAVNNSEILITGAGTRVESAYLDCAPSGGGNPLVDITNDAEVVLTGRLGVGNISDDGGDGVVNVRAGASVSAGNATLYRRGWLNVDGGSLTVNRLVQGAGSDQTLWISDPANGAALSIGNNNGSSTYDLPIEDGDGGPGSIAKLGNGTLSLGGDNTFSGGVTVNGGTLLATNTSGSAAGTGGAVINSGTLGGDGSVAGPTQVNGGGTVAPGASAGMLTVDDVTFESGSTLSVELAGNGGVAGADFDQLVVNGTATINPGATLDLSYLDAFVAAEGDSFVILQASGSLYGMFDTVIFPDGQNWAAECDTEAGTFTVSINSPTSCPSDLSGDGAVDLTDLGILLANYATGTTAEEGDLSGDGMVDLTDLGILLANYGAPCP